jgi:hypothetical protein
MLVSTSMKAKWHAHNALSFVPDQEELFMNKKYPSIKSPGYCGRGD